MSIESRSRQYGKVFEHWQIREFLGSGSGGKSAVFRLVHTDSSSVKSALKVISLIEKRGSLQSLSEPLKAEYEIAKKKCKDYAKQEVLLMNGLQGRTNVVDYQDHTFVDWEDETGFGCDMLIRMELLTDLRSQLENAYVFNTKDVLKIGRDICAALVLCHSKKILHRDIKPENIFINSDGNYKLGDFGVSRILSSAPTAMASTGIGTPEYAAPEQLSGKYDTRVDIYSLGLVLYELSNNNRLPFATSYYITGDEVQQRFLGKPLPVPQSASKELSDVILKACAHNPDDRYQTAEDFLADLNYLAGVGPRPTTKSASLCRTTEKAIPETSRYATQGAFGDEVRRSGRNETIPASCEQETSPRHYPCRREKISIPKGLIIGIVCLLIVAIGFAVSFGMDNAKKQDAINSYLDEANVSATSSDYVAALAKIEEGLAEYPDSSELQEKKDTYSALIEQAIATIVAESDTLVAEDNYVEAISKINSALITYPGNNTLLEKKDEYNAAYSAQIKETTLADAQAFADAGDYKSAMDLIQSAQRTSGDNPDFQIAYDTYHQAHISAVRTAALADAQHLEKDGDYLGASVVIAEAIEVIGTDTELTQLAAEYENKYVSDILSRADALAKDGKTQDAISVLDEALGHFPHNTLLAEKKTAINNAKPQNLLSVCPPYQTAGYTAERSYSLAGNSYINGFHLNDNHGGIAYFNLSGRYSTLNFDVGHIDGKDMRTGYYYFYLDGVLVETLTLDSSMMVEHYDISLEGASQLVIQGGNWCHCFALVNTKITPSITTPDVSNDHSVNNGKAKYLLNECPPYQTEGYYTEKTYSLAGENYVNGFHLNDNHGGIAYYNLNGKYNTLSFDVGHIDGKQLKTGYYYFYLDGELIHTLTLDPSMLVEHVDIPLNGATQLVIEGGNWCHCFALVNATISTE